MLARFVGVGCLLLCTSSMAFAQSDEEPPAPEPGVSSEQDERARHHFQSGLSYYQEESYEDALREFQRSYDLSQRPQLLVSISSCHERMLNFDEAIRLLEQYQGEVDAETDPQAEMIRGRISHLRRLREGAASAVSPVPSPSREPRERRGIAGWTIAGTGGATLIIALATGLASQRQRDDAAENCVVGRFCDAQTLGALSHAERLGKVSTGTTIVGAVLVTGGLLLALIPGGAADHEIGDDEVSPEVQVSTDAAWVGVRGRF